MFLGTTVSQLAGTAKTICIIGDSLYRQRKPAIDAGAMLVLAHGTDAEAETYEIANVAPDKRATFRITLKNNSEVDTEVAAEGERFSLFLNATSNPDGAKVYIDGAPVSTNPTYWIKPGEPVTKTLEIERGTVDDYLLTIGLFAYDCFKTSATMDLAVHFLPVSTTYR